MRSAPDKMCFLVGFFLEGEGGPRKSFYQGTET